MQKQNEAMAHQRSAPRWKEWIPLVTQQLRLRNLIQVIAYNVGINGEDSHDVKIDWAHQQKQVRTCCSPDYILQKQKSDNKKFSFYYTLHLTTMSSPFYTSEKLESENPKWEEIEVNDFVGNVNTAVNGIVIRLWLHRKQEKDVVLTVWGVYFNGLIYLGPKLCSDPSSFCINTIVFHMHGGYFTAPECFKEQPQKIRNSRILLNQSDVRPSYTVSLLLRLHTVQQAIKKQMLSAQSLREKITLGGLVPLRSNEGESLFRLLNVSQSKNRRQEILKLKQEIEKLKFKVSLLSQEKRRKQEQVVQIEKMSIAVTEENQDRGINLMAKYEHLYKETEQLKEWRKSYLDARESFVHINAQLNFRRRQLISELSFIYPIVEESTDKFTIAGVHLPNSEDFTGHEENTISVALGYVAHVVQMISVFLQVPLRYPIIHFGSRSKIVDHISDKIPDKDREFPLFSRGKDKLQFNYGVYLLNKNIAQLRWYFGLPTQDLRATLPNMAALLQLGSGANNFDITHHAVSSSSLDLRSSSQNISSPGSVQTVFRKGHRVSKSMGSTELHFQVPAQSKVICSVHQNGTTARSDTHVGGSSTTPSTLSYSLDKGLDEYHEMKKSEDGRKTVSDFREERVCGNLGHVGSEPILSNKNKYQNAVVQEPEATSSADEGQKKFLQNWQARGPAPICSDDDADVLQAIQLPSELITGSLAGEVMRERHSTQHNEDLKEETVNGDVVSSILVSPVLKSICVDSLCNSLTANEGSNHVEVDMTEKYDVSCPNTVLTLEQNRTPGVPGPGMCENSMYSHSASLSDDVSILSTTVCPLADIKAVSVINERLDSERSENGISLSEACPVVGETALVDNMFENVTVRTEALASRSGSFNLVRSRHSSMIDD
ncbi:UV radiation resistance-associated gene protein [Schistocerca cancellata]|uniref:UV radiation resistance-associated gene protein n=1 Tax=Schistocerca cancellata TaxID=274614 RepID=UPI002117E449|nr:UV radiation resistance-associated gene protein [Schistocerca cancellata]